jgi:hypothetical protein
MRDYDENRPPASSVSLVNTEDSLLTAFR